MIEQYDQLWQRWKYNRGNKLIAISLPTIPIVYEVKINCTTIKKILKPQFYKGVIMQQNNSTEEQPWKKKKQKKKKELPQHIDEGNSMKTGFGCFRYFTFFFLNVFLFNIVEVHF